MYALLTANHFIDYNKETYSQIKTGSEVGRGVPPGGKKGLVEEIEDKDLRKIVLMKLSGHTNKEIAKELGIARRSVERKLQLIRAKWDCL